MLPQPVLAANAPGIITGVTPVPPTVALIPPPGIVTTLPIATPKPPTVDVLGAAGLVPAEASLKPAEATPATPGAEEGGEEEEAPREEPQTLQQQENMMIKGSNARHMLMRKLMRRTESCVVVLRNMVAVEDLDDELEAEVTDECGRFGTVKRVIIYQERQSEDDNADIVVKIFVEFSQAQGEHSQRGCQVWLLY